MPFVEGADGQRVAYDIFGSGPPVILLHGGGQTRHSWKRTATTLAEHGYQAIIVDSRGHGDSDWTSTYGLDRSAADLRSILAILEPGAAPAIIGASMGGLIAIALLGGKDPPEASALMLVDIALRNRADGTRQIRDFMQANHDGFASIEEAADAVSRYMTDRPRPGNISGLRRNLRERDGRLYWHWDPKLMAGTSSSETPSLSMLDLPASRLKLPVMLIRGEHSAVIDAESIAHLRSLVPHMQAAEVAGAGHMVAGDANSPFTDAIIAFLARHHPVSTAALSR